MIIALFINPYKDEALQIAAKITTFLESKGITVTTSPKEAPDFFISIGGDGTILQLFSRYHHFKTPIIGVNLGGVGFLADIPLSSLYESLEELLAGHFSLTSQLVLHAEGLSAINDIVIHRAEHKTLIHLALFIDGRYVNTFSADGLIIASPSGSTAYSLAAGGPILTPELEAWLITPISPHTISNRPLLVSSSSTITVTYLAKEASILKTPIEVTFDGISTIPLALNESIVITKKDPACSFVKLHSIDFFATLRNKLGWMGKMPSY